MGGLGVEGGDGSSLTVNIPTVGRIPRGASIEKMVENPFINSTNVILNLHQGDFSTALTVSEAINDIFGDNVAVPLDASSIKVRSPKDPSQKVAFVSLLENIEVEPSRPAAKVVVNARTGTIVIGGDVRVTPAAVTHVTATGGAIVNENQVVTTPGDAVVTPETDIEVEEEPAKAFVFDPGVSLSTIVDTINAVGAGASDLVAILEALRESGALRAELIII